MLHNDKEYIEQPIGIDLVEIYGEVEGRIIDDHGAESIWGPGSCSKFIPVKQKYVFEMKGTCDTWNKVIFYDGENNYIGKISDKFSASTILFGFETKYEIPERAKYMRVNLRGQNYTYGSDYYIKRMK